MNIRKKLDIEIYNLPYKQQDSQSSSWMDIDLFRGKDKKSPTRGKDKKLFSGNVRKSKKYFISNNKKEKNSKIANYKSEVLKKLLDKVEKLMIIYQIKMKQNQMKKR